MGDQIKFRYKWGIKFLRNRPEIDFSLTFQFRVEKIEVDEHGLLVIKGNPNDMVDFDMKRG